MSADNLVPPTLSDLKAAATRLNLTIRPTEEVDYLEIIGNLQKAAESVLALADYIPPVDIERFSRDNIRYPSEAENPSRAWGWKADVRGSNNGLLSGRTVCLKDNICLKGVPCLFGTNAIKDFIPSVDASIVTRILENGGNIVGKATCENMSHGAASFSSPFGPVENPYAKGFTTGGSSSGCGSLIGMGEVEVGMGGDQGGSIRIPASQCGIVGLKPTFGLIPYTGVLSSEPSLDHVGPMARSVLDVALLLAATAGYDSIDDRQLGCPLPALIPAYASDLLARRKDGIRGLRIGILKEAMEIPKLQPEVDTVVRQAIAKFTEMGAVVEEVSVPLHHAADAAWIVVSKLGATQTRQGRQCSRRGLYINDFSEKLLPWTQDTWDNVHSFLHGSSLASEYGWKAYPTVYGRAMNLARQLKDSYEAALNKYDVLVMPTVPYPARRHIPFSAAPMDAARQTAALTSNTSPMNLTGHPALSLPVGWAPPVKEDILSPDDMNIKLPVGLQIVGKMWDEATVLRVADAWEYTYDWKTGAKKADP